MSDNYHWEFMPLSAALRGSVRRFILTMVVVLAAGVPCVSASCGASRTCAAAVVSDRVVGVFIGRFF